MPTPEPRPQEHPLSFPAFILAGGESRRMGTPKAFASLQGRPLIQHVADRLAPLFQQVYVVARETEGFTSLGLPIMRDAMPQKGPLAGLYSGLVQSQAPWCLAVGCDMPFLSGALVGYMARFLSRGDIVAARVQGHDQPLPAFYSQRCLPHAQRLLSEGNTSLRALMSSCKVVILPEEELAPLDPDLRTFLDLDTPEQLAALDRED